MEKVIPPIKFVHTNMQNDWLIPYKPHCTKKWSFPLMISSVNGTKSAVSCGFKQIGWRNL